MVELPRVDFKVLGPVEAHAEGRALALGGAKQRTLLAALLVNADAPVSGDRLCDAIWGETPPASAQANVRSYVAALRRALGPGSGEARLGLGHRGYRLRLRPDELDLRVFEDLAARGRTALAEGEHRTAARHLREALALWRGSAFEGVAHHDTLQLEAARLEEMRLTVLEDYADARLALGEHHETVGLLQTQVAEHPLRESLWAKLMLAQYRCHRPGDALKSYARARAALRDELGLEPGDALRRMHRAVLNRDPSLGAAPAPVTPPVRPVAVWRPIDQLPSDTADFTGRDILTSRLAALLEPAGAPGPEAPPAPVPVVVLTGLPGIGKTTLATRLAHLLRHAFPDGQIFLRLNGARGPRRAPGAVLADLLRDLGVAGSSIPGTTVERSAMFRALLADRRVLIVLDDARDEEQIRPLLPATPGCAVVITTRDRPEGLDGAHLVDVAPFDGEEAHALLRRIVGCGRLAMEPEATQRVLAGCAGLPLALRVAGAELAAREHRPVARLAARIDAEEERMAGLTDGRPDGPAVHASIAAGYCGLAPEAARAFRAIGMLPSPEFPGWVLSALLDTDDTDSVVTALLDANLVQVVCIAVQGQPRYRMHDLLHAYAARRAQDEDPPEWRREAMGRYVDGWLRRARTAGAQLLRVGSGDPVGWLENERHSLVTALEFAAKAGYAPQTAALAAVLEDICHLRNWWDEWDRVARAALDCATTAGDAVATAAAQGSLARASAARGHVDDAVLRFATAIEQLDALGEERRAARLRVHRGFAVADRGMARLALEDAESAAEVLGRLGDREGRVLALRSLGHALVCLGRPGEAVRVLEPAVPAAERLGHPLVLADVLELLAVAESEHGRSGPAARHLHRALAEYRLVRHRPGEAHALQDLGQVYVELGADQAPRALAPLTEAAVIFAELGDLRGAALTSYWLGRAHAGLDAPGRAAGHLTEALSGFRGLHMPFWAERAQREITALDEDRAGAAPPARRG
ncbi:BTAD domain-containing putative transcriptional regulator [Streptomyces gamaensis]|uniref:BTAD domain-containing putative transcriptional regulator n=1 Tax=Streptomyces gamaensis TaxID=1763542 RepID=A0ABW0YVG0_9ACTN